MNDLSLNGFTATTLVFVLIGVGMALQWWIVGRRAVPLSPRRKIALSLWGPPRDSYIQTTFQVRADAALAYVKELSDKHGTQITLTHLVGKVMGLILEKIPEFNRTLVCNRLVQHSGSSVSFLVALDKGRDTGWVKLDDVATKDVVTIARELSESALRIRRDAANRRGGLGIRWTPVFIVRRVVALTGWLAGGLGLPLRPLGIDRYPFGRIVVINSSAFGVESAYVSRTAFAHVPMNVVLCKVMEQPVAVDGKIEVQRCFNLCVNVDHRYVDGLELGRAHTILRRVMEDPWRLDIHKDLG